MQNDLDNFSDIHAYIESQKGKELLRFITCGSVDDGKSTLIGRLLYESKMLFEDQLDNLKAVSKKMGTQGDDIDFALLVDGLAAEREQGITIDVAYRYFNTEERKFIVIDTPGHEQYTRNMATGASQASAAILMVDARNGMTTQTKRHSYIVSALGIKNILIAINKMDLVDYSEETYTQLIEEYTEFAKTINVDSFDVIPLSALRGDNVITQSDKMPWYKGPTILEYLNTVPVEDKASEGAFRMPVQMVLRPDLDFRGYSGRITSGEIKVGDKVTVLPSGVASKVSTISTYDGDFDKAIAGQSVTICLEDEVDISRGDVLIVESENTPTISDQIQSRLVWMSETPLRIGQTYRLKLGTQTVNATVSRLDHVVDVNTQAHLSQDTLALNEIGECTVFLETPIICETYDSSRDLGGFILVDRLSNATVALGLIENEESSLSEIKRTIDFTIRPEDRSLQKNQKPVTVWFSGFHLAGKSYVANELEKILYDNGYHSTVLDPGNVFEGISEDLEQSSQGTLENARRVAHIAKLMNEAGLIVMTCFDSAQAAERNIAKNVIGASNYVEIFMETPLEISLSKDRDGFYRKAMKGEIKNVSGIDVMFEEPESPDLKFSLKSITPKEAAEKIFQYLDQNQRIKM